MIDFCKAMLMCDRFLRCTVCQNFEPRMIKGYLAASAHIWWLYSVCWPQEDSDALLPAAVGKQRLGSLGLLNSVQPPVLKLPWREDTHDGPNPGR